MTQPPRPYTYSLLAQGRDRAESCSINKTNLDGNDEYRISFTSQLSLTHHTLGGVYGVLLGDNISIVQLFTNVHHNRLSLR